MRTAIDGFNGRIFVSVMMEAEPEQVEESGEAEEFEGFFVRRFTG